MHRKSLDLRAEKLETRVKMVCARNFACIDRGLRLQMQGDRVLQPVRGFGDLVTKTSANVPGSQSWA